MTVESAAGTQHAIEERAAQPRLVSTRGPGEGDAVPAVNNLYAGSTRVARHRRESGAQLLPPRQRPGLQPEECIRGGPARDRHVPASFAYSRDIQPRCRDLVIRGSNADDIVRIDVAAQIDPFAGAINSVDLRQLSGLARGFVGCSYERGKHLRPGVERGGDAPHRATSRQREQGNLRDLATVDHFTHPRLHLG